MIRLEEGQNLTENQAEILTKVVSKLREDKTDNLELIDIKRKQLDLMAKVF